MIDFGFDKAFEPMKEPLVWRQDKAPHRSGTFDGVLLHGAPNSQSAGSTLAPQLADPWIVTVDRTVALCAGIVEGDTITRGGFESLTLTVQQVAKDHFGWIITCTENERAPL